MTKDEILNMKAGLKMNRLVADYVNPEYGLTLDYSEDIEYAYRVIEILAKEPYAWRIESVNLSGGIVNWWACLWGDIPNGGIIEYEAKADTLPHAICKAALLSVLK